MLTDLRYHHTLFDDTALLVVGVVIFHTNPFLSLDHTSPHPMQELAASQSIIHKRTGYLVCSCCLSPEHEFRFMLVNQMQRDLISSNLLESCGALIAVTNLITSDLVGTVSTQVMGLLEHTAETVRKKAIIALHRLHQLAPDVVTRQEVIDKVRRLLCDRDPAVMGSTLNVIETLARVDVQPFKDLVPSLISILKQICERRLPSEYDYHRIPAPWMQMKIVRILSVIGKNDMSCSEGMYEILGECLRKAEEAGINASNAIVYECIRCITNIYPNPVLLDAAGASISRFLSSRVQNLRYLGVTGLASIVERHPKYAADHQLAVIECLEDKDETLLRKTLDLLYRMTNPVNVVFITDRLLHFLRGSTDPYLKSDLTTKICNIAERYAPNNAWYVSTITELFRIAGDLVDPVVATNLMSLIAEGTGNEEDDEEADMVLRKQAVELYVNLLSNPPNRMPRVLVETLAVSLSLDQLPILLMQSNLFSLFHVNDHSGFLANTVTSVQLCRWMPSSMECANCYNLVALLDWEAVVHQLVA